MHELNRETLWEVLHLGFLLDVRLRSKQSDITFFHSGYLMLNVWPH